MYVGVLYYKEEVDGYSGREYTYQTVMELKVGDKVIAPTGKNPEQRAMVANIDLPEPDFPCREITRYYVPRPVEDAIWED